MKMCSSGFTENIYKLLTIYIPINQKGGKNNAEKIFKYDKMKKKSFKKNI